MRCGVLALLPGPGPAALGGGSALLLLLVLLPDAGVRGDSGAPRDEPAAASPALVPRRPFVVVWNMPTARCQRRYGVTLDLDAFDIVENRRGRFLGQNMTIFYRSRLGLYPYISAGGRAVNGGVPQQAPLGRHLGKAGAQMRAALNPDFRGLAVIDWEEWRPLWARNWGRKQKYRQASEQLVRARRPELPEGKVAPLARREFEAGARELMSRTLDLGVQLRPGGLWGFYGFPDCYNYYKGGAGYSGRCHPGAPGLNDRLDWLWRRSTALYPSVYLTRRLGASGATALFVRHRLLEAMRVASKSGSARGARPVLPYARVAYAHTLHYLSQSELEQTLGESAALGAAGVVLWGDLSFAGSKVRCRLTFIFIAARCSELECSGNGRCARRDPHSGATLPSASLGSPGEVAPPGLRDSAFSCVCYQGWAGPQCQDRLPSAGGESTAAS
nr:PREDICTED: hyaluronidase-3-like [Lepisosteus oculatus]